MMKLHPKYLSGLIAVAIYFFIVALVFYYFGYNNTDKAKHFVEKNSNVISVSLAGAKKPKTIASKTAKSKVHKKPKYHTKSKPIKSSKIVKKRIKKPLKKPPKKIKTKNLFADIKTSHPKAKKLDKKKAQPKHTRSQAGNKGRSNIKKGKEADKGIENRYLARVQEKLYGWPAQSNFAGAVVVIGLSIHPNGSFKYEILQPSDNSEFNRTIEQYLKQLQHTGFDPTPSGKSYKFKVEIKAK